MGSDPSDPSNVSPDAGGVRPYHCPAFGGDPIRGGPRIFGRDDRAADDEIRGAGGQRLCGRHRPRLIAFDVGGGAARITVLPPAAWTLIIQAPSRVAAATAPATVLGMS